MKLYFKLGSCFATLFLLTSWSTTSHANWECVIDGGSHENDHYYSSNTDDTCVAGPGATYCWLPHSVTPFWWE